MFLYGEFTEYMIQWFKAIDIWGNRGVDRDDGGIYFELPLSIYDLFINNDLRLIRHIPIEIKKDSKVKI